MAIPADMQHVPTIIEKRYVALVDKIAQKQRISRSRAMRNLVIEALDKHFFSADCFLQETKESQEKQE
jgi:hypothetical protein